MLIEVTEEDIRNGKCRQARGRPVALALKKVFPNHKICVTIEEILIDSTWKDAPTPVRNFVKKFDSDESVRPFSFEVPE